ncbi:MAG TPA: hypothetical protein VFP05_16195 [Thermomicrobiales bacterium]|nr:hypothetical protein [Thermomicrobiales bacterium]
MDQERDLTAVATSDDRTQLFKVREALLNLHKALLNVERARYEYNVGPVANEFEFFRLATSDPSFAWIGPLTTLIVQIDEQVANKEPISVGAVESLYSETRAVLASSTETPFKTEYNQLLQENPDLVMKHSAVMQALPPLERARQ